MHVEIWKISFVTFSSKFENKIKGVTMTERQYRDPSPCDRCGDQLLFVVGRELLGNLQDILRVCLCALIRLFTHDFLSARHDSLLTRNYATRRNKRMRSKQTLRSLEHFHRRSVLSLYVQSRAWTRDDFLQDGIAVKQTLLEKQCAGQNPACSVFMSLQCLPVSDRLCLYVVPVGLHDPDALTQHHPPPPSHSPFPLLAANEYRQIQSSHLMTDFITIRLRLLSCNCCRWDAISLASQTMCSNILKYLHGESPSMLEISQGPSGSVLNPKDLLAVGHTCKVQIKCKQFLGWCRPVVVKLFHIKDL